MENKVSPLISVVIPLYNHERYISATLESVIAQHYRPIQIVVVDDGSSDGSYLIAKTFEQRSAPHLEIRVHLRENGGPAAAMNFGVSRSSGSFIAIIASDDYYLPGALESSAEVFRSRTKQATALVHSTVLLLDSKGRLTSTEGEHDPAIGSCLLRLLSRQAGIWAPTMMFTRDSYDAVGGFDESIECEDYDFYARLAARGYEFAFNARDTVVKRVLPTSLGANVKRWYEAPFQILDRHREILTAKQYAEIRSRLHLYVVALAAGSGNYSIAWWAATQIDKEIDGRFSVIKAYLLILRYRVLNIIPFHLRLILRQLRAFLRRGGKRTGTKALREEI